MEIPDSRWPSFKNESGYAGKAVILVLTVMGELAPQTRNSN